MGCGDGRGDEAIPGIARIDAHGQAGRKDPAKAWARLADRGSRAAHASGQFLVASGTELQPSCSPALAEQTLRIAISAETALVRFWLAWTEG